MVIVVAETVKGIGGETTKYSGKQTSEERFLAEKL